LTNTVQETGFTYDANGSSTSYNLTTGYDYDSKGRVTKLNGPRPSLADDVDYTYYGSGNGDKTDYRNEEKRQTGASTYLVTTFGEYTPMGFLQRRNDPNSK